MATYISNLTDLYSSGDNTLYVSTARRSTNGSKTTSVYIATGDATGSKLGKQNERNSINVSLLLRFKDGGRFVITVGKF